MFDFQYSSGPQNGRADRGRGARRGTGRPIYEANLRAVEAEHGTVRYEWL
jgi:hypothetical protein